jgi:hypothetical protein
MFIRLDGETISRTSDIWHRNHVGFNHPSYGHLTVMPDATRNVQMQDFS